MSEGLPKKKAKERGPIGERGGDYKGPGPADWLEVVRENGFGDEGDRVSRLAPPLNAVEVDLNTKPNND